MTRLNYEAVTNGPSFLWWRWWAVLIDSGHRQAVTTNQNLQWAVMTLMAPLRKLLAYFCNQVIYLPKMLHQNNFITKTLLLIDPHIGLLVPLSWPYLLLSFTKYTMSISLGKCSTIVSNRITRLSFNIVRCSSSRLRSALRPTDVDSFIVCLAYVVRLLSLIKSILPKVVYSSIPAHSCGLADLTL